MTLTATWGPKVSETDFAGTLQDIPALIEFITEGSTITGQFLNETGWGMFGSFNGTPLTIFSAGSGLVVDSGTGFLADATGTLNTVSFMLGGDAYLFAANNNAPVAADVFLTIEGTFDLAVLIPAVRAEISGEDVSAVEDFFAAKDWIYNGIGGQDVFDNGITSSDNVPLTFDGNDVFTLGGGDDVMFSGNGNDTVNAGTGSDFVNGGAGADFLRGGKQEDTLEGGGGDDSIVGQSNADTLSGQAGDDTLKGGGGNDYIVGGNGDDFLKGGTRVDNMRGQDGNDRMAGNRFDDTLDGGAGNDRLNAGGDDDVLIGGRGNDWLKGGTGSDVFVFGADAGDDTVRDFTSGDDVIDLSGVSSISNFTDLLAAAEQQGADVLIDLSGGDSILLQNENRGDLTGDDFAF